MKLRYAFSFAMVMGLAGCTGGTVSTAGDVSGVAGELKGEAQLLVHKRRDLPPAKSPEAKLSRANMRLVGATGGTTVVPQAVAAAAQPHLGYQNGPILQSVEIYAVFWGPNVNADVQKNIGGFFTGITAADSGMQKMLAEYNTPTGMNVGSGSFKGAVTDMDAPIPSSNTITDEMIEAEAARLVDTGQVPAEDGKNILMFFFPPNVTIDQGGGSLSCQVFCAYHSTFSRNGDNFYYGVIPDQGSNGCEQGCGSHDQLNNTYSTTSHELIEAITDPGVGLNQIGWYDDTSGEGEIGDICVEWDGTANNYTVQSEWSNMAGGCTDHAPANQVGLTVSYDNTVVTSTGSSATFNLTTTGSSGAIKLATAGLFTGTGGFTATFSPATINAGQSATLTVAVPAGIRSQDVSFKVAATDVDGVNHFAPVTMHVKGAAPTITSADVTTGPSQGGTAVTITGTNFGVGAIARVCSGSSTTCDPTKSPNSAGNFTTLQGGYVGGTSGKTFQLVTAGHTVGTTGSTKVKIFIYNPNDPTPVSTAFTFTKGAAPTVTGVSPASGPAGTFVTVTGTNFSSNSALTFGTQAVDCSASSRTCAILDDKTIILLTPGTDTGMVGVQVTNIDTQTGSLANAYDYGKAAPPSVDSLSLDTGTTAGGDYVTIFGENFDNMATVTFDGVAASVKTRNGSFLGVVTPPHAAGMVDVVVSNADAQTAKSTFTYSDTAGGGGDGGVTDDGGTGGTGGGGSGGGGGNGNNGGGPITVTGNNTLGNSGGCAVGGDASSFAGLLLVGFGLFFATRRRRA